MTQEIICEFYDPSTTVTENLVNAFLKVPMKWTAESCLRLDIYSFTKINKKTNNQVSSVNEDPHLHSLINLNGISLEMYLFISNTKPHYKNISCDIPTVKWGIWQ